MLYLKFAEYLLKSTLRLFFFRPLHPLQLIFLGAGLSGNGYIRFFESGKRKMLDIPGVRGIKFSRAEAAVIDAFRRCVEQLPEGIKARGVLNYTEDGMWSVLLPDAGFRHKQFLVMKSGLYQDHDHAVMEFIRQRRPVVLSCRPLEVERYSAIFSAQYMGNDYFLYVPWE